MLHLTNNVEMIRHWLEFVVYYDDCIVDALYFVYMPYYM